MLKVLRLIRLVRLLRLARFVKLLSKYEDTVLRDLLESTGILMNCLFILWLTHLLACTWYYTGIARTAHLLLAERPAPMYLIAGFEPGRTGSSVQRDDGRFPPMSILARSLSEV